VTGASIVDHAASLQPDNHTWDVCTSNTLDIDTRALARKTSIEYAATRGGKTMFLNIFFGFMFFYVLGYNVES